MTPQELKALIDGDATTKALFAAGSDVACAERCMVIAQKSLRETRLSRLGILSLYDDPAIGYAVLGTIDAVAEGNPIVAEIKKFMEPGVHPSCLPDWSLKSIRESLTKPVQSGGLGLTAEQAGPILAAAEVVPLIIALDVSNARGC